MNSVTVRVPATSANLGPGFDCLAIALELYNEIRMGPADDGIRVEVQGEGAGSLPDDEGNLVAQAALRAFESLDERPPGLDVHCNNRIPLGSGLGSSAAAVIGGLFAANALVKGGMSDEELLFLAFALEGHADNAAAALNGGLNLVRARPAELIVRKVPTPQLQVALAVPGFELPTDRMRDVLPEYVSLDDAVDNMASLGLLLEALREANYDLLQEAADDRLHQPHRVRRIPGAEAALEAARAAGAAAAVISGAGPSLLAFAEQGLEGIAEAMTEAFAAAGHEATPMVLDAAQEGASVDRGPD